MEEEQISKENWGKHHEKIKNFSFFLRFHLFDSKYNTEYRQIHKPSIPR